MAAEPAIPGNPDAGGELGNVALASQLQQHPPPGNWVAGAAVTVGPAAQFLQLQCPRLQPLTQSSSAREPNNPSCSRSIHSPPDPSLPPPPQQLPATQGTPDMVEVPNIPGFPAVTPAAKHQQPQGHTQRQRRRQATPLTERQQRRQSAHSLMEPEAPQVRETQNLRYTATY